MTPDLLMQATGCAERDANEYAALLTAACARWGIDTRQRRAHFVAQVAHESALFTRVIESFAYKTAERLISIFPRDFADLNDARAVLARGREAVANRVYAGQNGNGPEASGDGWRFRGRGLIQITGRANYEAYGRAIGVEVQAAPELLVQPHYAADSAGWFWSSRACNTWADSGSVRGLTRAINGGFNGLAERVALTERALSVAGL